MAMNEQQKKWLAGVLLKHGSGRSVPAALGGKYNGDPSQAMPGEDEPTPPVSARTPHPTAAPNGRPPPAVHGGPAGKPQPNAHPGSKPAHAPPRAPLHQVGQDSMAETPGKPTGLAGSGMFGPLGIGLPTIVQAVEAEVRRAIKAVQGAGIGKPLVAPDLAGVASKVVQGIIDSARKKAERAGPDIEALEKQAKELLGAAEKHIADGVKTVKGVIDRVEKARKDLEAGKQTITDDARKTVDAVKQAVTQGGEQILNDAVDIVRTVAKDVGLEQQEKQVEAAAAAVKQGAETVVQTTGKVVGGIGAAERKIAGDVADTVKSVEKAVEQGVAKTLADAEAAAKGVIADIFG